MTPREQEVLGLLREGLTNRRIAERLGISQSGVAYHVSEILSKLGVVSREEAAAWQGEAAGRSRWRLRATAVLTAPLQKLAGLSAYKIVAAGALGAAGVGLGLLAVGNAVMGGSGEAPPASEDQTPVGLGKLVYIDDGDLWTLDLDGGGAARLTGDGRNKAPAWSPSGEWLTFEKPVDSSTSELWVMRADGSEARGLDAATYQQLSYAWSPNADRLAYLSPDFGRLVVEAADGAAREELLSATDRGWDGLGGFIRWSPDGQWLAVAVSQRGDLTGEGPLRAGYVGLWAVRADGSEARELVAAREVGYGLLVAGWSPDSTRVIYSPDPSFSASFIADGLQWYAAELDTVDGAAPPAFAADGEIDNERRVLRYDDYQDISPDGKALLAVRGGGRDTYLNKAIARVGFDAGVQFHDLTSPEVAALSPAWSPDGRTIAYVQQPTDQGSDPISVKQRRIWLMDTDGANKRRLTEDETWEERPQWSRDGKSILYLASPEEVPVDVEPRGVDVVLRDLASGDETVVLTDIGYFVNVGRTIWYYGHYSWDQIFDWWQP